jgi:hypothetical protein
VEGGIGRCSLTDISTDMIDTGESTHLMRKNESYSSLPPLCMACGRIECGENDGGDRSDYEPNGGDDAGGD